MEKKYELKKSDLEELDGLLKTVTSIDTLYKKLYELEISNNKDSEEYKKTIEYLKIALEVEEEKYKKILSSSEKVFSLLDYLLLDKMSIKESSNIESLLSQETPDRITRRIISVLNKELAKDFTVINQLIPKELFMVLKMIGIEDPEKMIMDDFKKKIELDETLEQETLNIFVKILEEFINDEEYSSFKNQLLKIKYDVAFLNKNLESQLLFSRFNILTALLFDSKFIYEFLNLNSMECQMLSNKYGADLVSFEIEKLIKSRNYNYDNQKDDISNILRQSYLRAGLLLLDDDIIDDLKFMIDDLIDEVKYFKPYYNNKGIEIVKEALEKNKEDRKTYKGESSNDMKLKLDPEDYEI